MKQPLDRERSGRLLTQTETLTFRQSTLTRARGIIQQLTNIIKMGSSTSKDEKLNGDNRATVKGDISMDDSNEYSLISFHSGTAIGIFVIIAILIVMYYAFFKIKCTHTGHKNNNNVERGMEIVTRQPKVEFAPRFVEVREEADTPKRGRYISREQLDSLFE